MLKRRKEESKKLRLNSFKGGFMKRENGLYWLSNKGLVKVKEPVTKLINLIGLTFFIGVALGYAWRMLQLH